MVRPSLLSRRNILLAIGLPIAMLMLGACPGFISADPVISHWYNPPNCPSYPDGLLAIPIECCPCPWDDMCPNGWPDVPAHCKTGCEPGQPIECCECPTPEWCNLEDRNWQGGPPHCADKPWRDGGAAGCSIGTCVPNRPEGWRGPAILTPEGWGIDPLPCPEGSETIDGWEEPAAPGCAECTCSTPESKCGFSATWTVSSHECGDFDNGAHTDFSPPAEWDGSCDATDTIPPGKLCNGVPCVAAIHVSAPTFEQLDTSCTPLKKSSELPPVKATNGGSDAPFGRVCVGKLDAEGVTYCGEENQDVCLVIPDGGMACIVRDGEFACPQGWPQKHLYYRNVKDERTCSECTCGPVEGAQCLVKHRVFSNALCSNENEYGSWNLYPGDTFCAPINSGAGLAGKSMEKIIDEPGHCQAGGGEVVGEVKKENPFTVCCLADDM